MKYEWTVYERDGSVYSQREPSIHRCHAGLRAWRNVFGECIAARIAETDKDGKPVPHDLIYEVSYCQAGRAILDKTRINRSGRAQRLA